MQHILNRFVSNEDGATVIEYGLIAAMISITIVGVLGDVSEGLVARFETVNSFFPE
jgi:pilus assembly protein Flp/PilA